MLAFLLQSVRPIFCKCIDKLNRAWTLFLKILGLPDIMHKARI
jgi:hypothetical protein